MTETYKQYTDKELVNRCISGDAQAWESLIMRYRRLIFSVPVRFKLNPTDAADVFQSVCVKLLEHLRDLKDEAKVGAWLITTTTRLCIHLREERFREEVSDDGVFEDVRDPSDVEALSAQIEEHEAIRDSVKNLPDRCRELIELLYFDNRSPSYEEISDQMTIPIASIGPTRARCLDKLRTVLRRRGIKSL